MTLAQLASLVCSKVGKTDDASLAACKDFLCQRHEMIYDSALWLESRDYAAFAFPATEDGYSTGARPGYPDYVARVIFPTNVGRVIALRCGADAIYPEQGYSVFNRDPNDFETRGPAVSFVEDGASAISWPLPNNASNQGDKLQFSCSSDDNGAAITVRGYAFDPLSANPALVTEVVTLAGGAGATQAFYIWTESISKPFTAGIVFVSGSLGGPIDEWAAEETERRHVVCRIVQRPKYDPASRLQLWAYFKRKIQHLRKDGDVPMVRNADNALIALAQADMLERGRQYSKAQLKIQEGGALVKELADLQADQGASLTQIQPDVGIPSGTRADFGW
jgi:hypothetical protein